jgi:hypothetical protein
VRRTSLQRAFTSFPSGWVGAALLVLRVIVGALTVIEAVLAVAANHALLNLVTAFVAAAAGLALVAGFLTPLMSTFVAVSGAAILIGLRVPVLQLLDTQTALFEFVSIAAALSILGPGAASIDARLFGRREVTIVKERRPRDS